MNGFGAAVLLAGGRIDGLGTLRAEPSDVSRSFVALAWAAVPLVLLRLMLWYAEAGPPRHATHLLLNELLVFSTAWLGFAVISHRLADRLGRGALWPRFMVVYNWCNVVSCVLVLVGSIPQAMGAPPLLAQVCQVVVTGWSLWLAWVAIRLTLRTGPLLAIYLVLIEQAIGISFAIAGATLMPR